MPPYAIHINTWHGQMATHECSHPTVTCRTHTARHAFKTRRVLASWSAMLLASDDNTVVMWPNGNFRRAGLLNRRALSNTLLCKATPVWMPTRQHM